MNSDRAKLPQEDFKPYRRSQIAELAEWHPGFDMTNVSVSVEDAKAGSPKPGDMIARNPKNHADRWLVAATYFADNFESAEQSQGAVTDEMVSRACESLWPGLWENPQAVDDKARLRAALEAALQAPKQANGDV